MNRHTPLAVVANISRVVTKVVDRLTGDRGDFPLLVYMGVKEALSHYGIKSQIMYGETAWIEIGANGVPFWAGCWDGHHGFWLVTEFNETVELNLSIAHRKVVHSGEAKGNKSLYSPPMLWTQEVPRFCKFNPEGVAHAEPEDPRDVNWWNLLKAEVAEKCNLAITAQTDQVGVSEFADEPISCNGRRILDDSKGSFKHFDRALSVMGIPPGPLE